MYYDYLILGNGIAGLTAADNIRKNTEGKIAIISEEPVSCYYRIRLTGLIGQDYDVDNILVKNDDFYKENNIDLILNTKVTKLDTENKKIITEDNTEYYYNKLLIAVGSHSFVPPIKGADTKGVYTLRDTRDLDEIKEHLQEVDKVAVIGGGLLGLEAAWALNTLGKEVHVLDAGDKILGRQLDTETSKILQKRLEEDIHIHLNAITEEISNNGEKLEIDLGNEKLEVGMVLLSTGVKANIDIAQGTDLEVNRGIVVDSHLKTNIEDIYAAGDIAEIQGITLGLWTGALEMGKVAGVNMTGGDLEYRVPKLFANLLIGDIKVFSAGNTSDDLEKLISEKDEVRNTLFVEDSKLVGAVLYGDMSLSNLLREAVFKNLDINKFLEENKLTDYKYSLT